MKNPVFATLSVMALTLGACGEKAADGDAASAAPGEQSEAANGQGSDASQAGATDNVDIDGSGANVTAARDAWASLIDPNERDAFTFANYKDVRISNAAFDLAVNFESKTLSGFVDLSLEYLNETVDEIILDTNGLSIDTITSLDGDEPQPLPYTIGDHDDFLGAPLAIQLVDRPNILRISYKTSPDAGGLQWLSPDQTASKEHPFLFSQNQAIYARTMAPLQDTPAVRFSYSARITTTDKLRVLMSAEQDTGERDGEYTFSMPQPIPSYLLAITVGDLKFKAISETVAVYAEDYILDASAAEFADTPQMVDANEALYGPYRWGRYDMLAVSYTHLTLPTKRIV